MGPVESSESLAGPAEDHASEHEQRHAGARQEDGAGGGDGGPDGSGGDLERLEREIVTAAAQIAAATHRFLTAVREFDEKRCYEVWGRRSTADWLSWRTGMSMGLAREKVRVARVLGRVPRIDEALRDAQISFSKARALTRVATPENEGELLATARSTTAHQLERVCRKFRQVALEEVEGDPLGALMEERHLRFRDLDNGLVQITVQVLPEEAAELRAILDDARVRAARAARAAARAAASDGKEEPPVAREAAPPPSFREEGSSFNRVDALLAIARSFAASPTFRSAGSPRCEVYVEVKRETLEGRSEEPALLADGYALSPGAAQRLSCDNAVVQVERDKDGAVLDIGRRSRSIPPAIARALRLRDKTCRFPGCVNAVGLDAHHVVHWAAGGKTSMDNLIRLCTRHHWCLHEGGFSVQMEEGRPVFRNPRGNVIEDAPPLLPGGMPGRDLIEWLHRHGPAPGKALPVPIADGRADWSHFLDAMVAKTYGTDPARGRRRMPTAEGFAPDRP